MANYSFKVQVSLPENVETLYHRINNVNAIDRYFYEFKNKLIERYDALSKNPFQITWLDHEGDEISIYTEEDLRICMEMKAKRLFIKANVVSDSNDNKSGTENIHPITRVPFMASCSSDLSADRHGLSRLSTDVNGRNPNHNSNAAPRIHSQPSCVQCNGRNGIIDVTQDCQYTCIECYSFNLGYISVTKKLNEDDDMLCLDEPLNSSLNSQTMMKQRCEEQNKESRRDNSYHKRHDGNASANVINGIAENVAIASTTASNENTIVAQDSGNRSAESDVKQTVTETLCTAFSKLINKCGVVEALTSPELKNTQFEMTVSLNPQKSTENTKNDILQSTQPSESLFIFDPCTIDKVISEIQTESQSKQTQSWEAKSNEFQKSVEKMHCDIAESQSTLLSGSVVVVVPISPAVATPDDITIKDVIETLTANDNDVEGRDSYVEHRDSSPISNCVLVDDDNGHVEGDQPRHTGAVPKIGTAPLRTDNIGSVDAAHAVPMRNTFKSQSSLNLGQFLASDEVIYHPNPRINEATIQMISMGFSNDDGWVTRLLERVNGNISLALDGLH